MKPCRLPLTCSFLAYVLKSMSHSFAVNNSAYLVGGGIGVQNSQVRLQLLLSGCLGLLLEGRA